MKFRSPFFFRAFFSLLLFTFLFNPTFSQISLGVKGGTNLATTVVGDYTHSFLCAYYGGIYSTIDLHKKLFLQAELYYSQKGYKYGPTFANGDALKFHYLCASALLGYRLPAKLSVLLGVESGYLLKSNLTGFTDVTDQFERFDLGLDAGLSYAAGKRWGVDLRYIRGLTLITPAVTHYSFGGTGIASGRDRGLNRAIQFGIYYKLVAR